MYFRNQAKIKGPSASSAYMVTDLEEPLWKTATQLASGPLTLNLPGQLKMGAVANNPTQIIVKHQPLRCEDLFAKHTTEANWMVFASDDIMSEEWALHDTLRRDSEMPQQRSGSDSNVALAGAAAFQRVSSATAEAIRYVADSEKFNAEEAYQEMMMELEAINEAVESQNTRSMTTEWKDMKRFPYWYLFTANYMLAPQGSSLGLPPPNVGKGPPSGYKEELTRKEVEIDRIQIRDQFDELSLGMFDLDHRTRLFCIRLVRSRLWVGLVPVVIACNVVLLGVTNPLEQVALMRDKHSPDRDAVVVFESLFTGFFLIECIIMILAHGFCRSPRSYLRSAPNVLDFLIVMTSLLDLVLGSAGGNFSALRSLRAAKPLRAISRSAQLRELMVILARVVPSVLAAVMLVSAVMFIGALLGLQLFKGVLRSRCYSEDSGFVLSQQVCMCEDCTILHSKPMGRPYSCPTGYACLPISMNPGSNSESFDDIGSSMLSLLQVLTLSGWSSLMHHCQDALSPAASMFFLGMVMVGPMQLNSYFVAVMATKIMQFRTQSWHARESANAVRWEHCNLRIVMQGWGDFAMVQALLQRRPRLRRAFKKTYLERISVCFDAWHLEVSFRNLLRSANGQRFLRFALARFERRCKKAPWHLWKYKVLRLKRKLKSVLDAEALLGSKSTILTFDPLGRPAVTQKQIDLLKTRFRRVEAVREAAQEDGAIPEEGIDIGDYLARRVALLSQASDVHERLIRLLQQVDAALNRAATSAVAGAAGAFMVTTSTLAMLMEHEFFSPVGDYWATERNYILFQRGLVVLGLLCSSYFFTETLLKLTALRRDYFVAHVPERKTWVIQRFNVLDFIVTITLAVEFPDGVARFRCLEQAVTVDECLDLSVGFAFLRVLRIIRIMRVARFVSRMPTIKTQIINMMLLGRRVFVFFSMLAIYYLVFSILGMQLFCGRLHSMPSAKNLVRGCDCYCFVPHLQLPQGSYLIGHPCVVTEISLDELDATPYRVAIKEGFRKTDVVLDVGWASADLLPAEFAQEAGSTLPKAIVEQYMGGRRSWGDDRTTDHFHPLDTGAGKVGEGVTGGGRRVGEKDGARVFNPTERIVRGYQAQHAQRYHQKADRRGDEVAGRNQTSHVQIVGVVPRLNFDTFFSSFSTVFITWTLTDWSSIMQPLLSQLRFTAIVYFLGMILVGNFLLQNFLAAAVIVEFRDRAHVRRIIEIRDANARVQNKMLALSGMEQIQTRGPLPTKEELRAQNLKEFAERQKMMREQEELSKADKVGRALIEEKEAAKFRGPAAENMEEEQTPFLERAHDWVQQQCRGAQKKVNTRATDTTCLCIRPASRFRRACNHILYTSTFEKGMGVMIVLSSALLAVRAERNSSTYRVILTLDAAMNMVFISECVLKVVARGWSQYLLTSLNKFDALIVAAAVAEEATKIALVMSIWDTLTPSKERDTDRDDPVLSMVFSALRALRIVRLFKLMRDQLERPGIRRFRSLALALEALTAAFKPISTALVLALCVLLLFALLGMQLFSGGMQRCSDISKPLQNTCQGIGPDGEARIWQNAALNFDWIGNAMLAVFTVATGDGWDNILYHGLDSAGREGPKQNSNLYAILFFVALQLAGFVFVTRLLLAVWVDTYASIAAITPETVSVAPTRRTLPIWEFEPGPVHPRRRAVYEIVMSRGFDAFMTAIVSINIAFMALSSYKKAAWQSEAAVCSEAFFSAVFGVEALLKLSAAYPSSYFKSPWNLFDGGLLMLNFIIAAVTPLLEALGGGDGSTDFLPTVRVLKFLRILKILRVVRVVKILKSLKAVIQILKRSASSVAILVVMMLFLVFNGAVVGSKFFGHLVRLYFKLNADRDYA